MTSCEPCMCSVCNFQLCFFCVCDVILYRIEGVEGGRVENWSPQLSLRQAVSHQSRLAGCSEQQQQHGFLWVLRETDGRLNTTKCLLRRWIQLLSQTTAAALYQFATFKSTFVYIYYIIYWASCFTHHGWLAETFSCEPQMRSCHHHVIGAPRWKKISELQPGQRAIVFSWLSAKSAC